MNSNFLTEGWPHGGPHRDLHYESQYEGRGCKWGGQAWPDLGLGTGRLVAGHPPPSGGLAGLTPSDVFFFLFMSKRKKDYAKFENYWKKNKVIIKILQK